MQKGVMIERRALCADPESEPDSRPHLHNAECKARMTHTNFSGDMVMVTEDPQRLQGMAADVARAARKEVCRIAMGKSRFWSSTASPKFASKVLTWAGRTTWRCLV